MDLVIKGDEQSTAHLKVNYENPDTSKMVQIVSSNTIDIPINVVKDFGNFPKNIKLKFYAMSRPWELEVILLEYKEDVFTERVSLVDKSENHNLEDKVLIIPDEVEINCRFELE